MTNKFARKWDMRDAVLLGMYERTTDERTLLGWPDLKSYFDSELHDWIIPNNRSEIEDTFIWLVEKGLAEEDGADTLVRYRLTNDGFDLAELNLSTRYYIAGKLGFALPSSK